MVRNHLSTKNNLSPFPKSFSHALSKELQNTSSAIFLSSLPSITLFLPSYGGAWMSSCSSAESLPTHPHKQHRNESSTKNLELTFEATLWLALLSQVLAATEQLIALQYQVMKRSRSPHLHSGADSKGLIVMVPVFPHSSGNAMGLVLLHLCKESLV